jgi:hypothetical protein
MSATVNSFVATKLPVGAVACRATGRSGRSPELTLAAYSVEKLSWQFGSDHLS